MDKPTSKRRKREREARREAILDAAARVFSRKSYFEATLDEIAAEAELAKGTLYNYYEDKQDIFSSLMERGHRQFQDQLDKVISENKKLRELIRRYFVVSIQTLQEHQYMFRLVLTAGAHLSEDMRSQVMKRWLDNAAAAADKMAKAFAVLTETEKLPEVERLSGARLVMSAIHSMHHRIMTFGKTDSLEDDIENYTRLLCRALTVERTP